MRVIQQGATAAGGRTPSLSPWHSAGRKHRAAHDPPSRACLSPQRSLTRFLLFSEASFPPNFYLLNLSVYLCGELYTLIKLLQILFRKKWTINETPSEYLPVEVQNRHHRHLSESRASFSGPKLMVHSSLCVDCLHSLAIPPQASLRLQFWVYIQVLCQALDI